MLFFIDNFDSFTHNIVHAFEALSVKVHLVHNDAPLKQLIDSIKPRCILVGPGPGNPSQLPQLKQLILTHGQVIPTLGICLGHQCLAEAFGASIIRAKLPLHGKEDTIFHRQHSLFSNLANPFTAGRYHSLVVDETTLPDCLEVVCRSSQNEIMGLCHKEHPLMSVQFHPESVLTPEGTKIIENFLYLAGY